MAHRETRRNRDRNIGASGPPSNSRAGELGTGSRVTSDAQPPTNGQVRAGEPESSQETESVSQPSLGTTNAGLLRRRIQWTTEMNEYVVREYLRCTRSETVMVGYRQEMYRNFVQTYPNLTHISEQNLADRRSAIYRRNLVTEDRRNEIQHELFPPEGSSEAEGTAGATEEEEHEPEPPAGPTGPAADVTAETPIRANLSHAYWQAVAEFEGLDPTSRPRIPNQHRSKKLSNLVTAANEVISNEILETISSYTELDNCMYCMAVAVVRMNGGKVRPPSGDRRGNETRSKQKKKPRWMTRLESRVADLRTDIGVLTAYLNGSRSRRMNNKVANIRTKYETHAQHNPPNASLEDVLDTMKQKLSVYSQRLRRYGKSHKRKTDNREFGSNQKAFYRNLRSDGKDTNSDVPDKDALENFWASIWSSETHYNANAVWLKTVEETSNNISEMADCEITPERFQQVVRNLQNWKCPGVDGLQNFWYKKLECLHPKMCMMINQFMQHPETVPAYLCEGRTYLISKGSDGTNPANYRPITCLTAFYKIITGCILTLVRTHCEENEILAVEQKGCCKGSLGCKEQLIIDSVIMSQATKEKRNIHTSFIDYKKAFDMVPHDWLLRVLSLYKIDGAIIAFLRTLMSNWCTTVSVGAKQSTVMTSKIAVKRGIFQGDTLSPYWFCLALNPLATMLNRTGKGFEIKKGRSKHRITHLSYMDDLKLYSATKEGLQTLLRVTEQFSNDIRMEFGVSKCRMQILHRGKPTQHEPYTTTTDELITAMEAEEVYKYLGITQSTTINHTQVKTAVQEDFVKRLRLVLKTALNARNLSSAINTFAIPVITFTMGIVKWSDTDIANLERIVRVMMTRFRCHHPKSALERVDIPRKMGGRGIISISNLQGKTITNMRTYFQQKAETSPLHQMVVLADENYTPLNLGYTNLAVQQVSLQDKIQLWKQKALHGRYPAEVADPIVDSLWTHKWLSIGYLFPETEGFMVAIQDQVIATRNYMKYIIKDPNITNDSCRMCSLQPETIQHLVGGCQVLAPTEYKARHDAVGAIVHKALAKKYNLVAEMSPSYIYEPLNVLENDEVKLYWDRSILTDRTVQHDRPDLTLWNKRERKVWLIDFAVVLVNNLQSTYQTKMQKYAELARIVKEQWRVNRVEVVPIVIAATGIVPVSLKKSLKLLNINENIIIEIQKTTILKTCRTVRKVLGEYV